MIRRQKSSRQVGVCGSALERAPPFRAKRRESAARGRADSNDRWLQRAALQRSAAVWVRALKRSRKRLIEIFRQSGVRAWYRGKVARPYRNVVANGETGGFTRHSLTPGSAHCTGKPRGSGWDSGRTKLPYLLTYPRGTRSPPIDAFRRRIVWRLMEEGPECCRRAEWSLGPPSGAGYSPRTTAVDRRSTPSGPGGPTRTSADVSLEFRCAACRLFAFLLLTIRKKTLPCCPPRRFLPREVFLSSLLIIREATAHGLGH